MKTRPKLHRARFRTWKTIKGVLAAFRRPDNPKRILTVKKSGVSRYCMDDMKEGVGPDITVPIQQLFDNGSPGDKVTITLDEMDAEEYEALDDWEGWSN